MPQAEKKYTDPMQDGRRKIHPKEHEVIREIKKSGMTSRQIAKNYKVSVSLIKLIVYPRVQEAVRERNKLKWKDYQLHYGKKYHAEAIQKLKNKKKN